MKCLSLWQPWATLMAIGAKRIETRSWATRHRGWIAIHAAQHWTRDIEAFCFAPAFLAALRRNEADADRAMIDRLKSARGHILCLVRIVDCIQFTEDNRPKWGLSDQPNERHFGDYRVGRFGWRTDGVIQLPEPIPYRARQRLFELDAATSAILQGRAA